MRKNTSVSLLCYVVLSIGPSGIFAQSSIELGGMKMYYRLRGDSVDITIEAPTKGWLGIGFNQKNDIVQSDLLLFHVVDGEAEVLDMYVKGVGDPRQDITMGGTNDIRIIKAEESNQSTVVSFSKPISSADRYDFQHQPGEEFWLILAYSTHDEFDHHSRMRKHIPFQFE